MFGSKADNISKENLIFSFLKGIIVAMLLSLGLIILFAFCLKWFTLPETVIVPTNLAIKAISVIIGTILAVNDKSKGLFKGFAFGIIYILVAFIIFSLLAGGFSAEIGFGLDLLFGGLLGGIVGIVKVNKR